MNSIDRLSLNLRYAARRTCAEKVRLRKFLPEPARQASCLVRQGRPARLVLDLARGWKGLPSVEPHSLDFWRQVVLSAVEWLGPVPVTILVRSTRISVHVPDIVRFARRLECPVLLLGQCEGISEELALSLIDAGLRSTRIFFGGVSPGVYAETVGGDLPGAAGALLSLLEARDARGAPLGVLVDFPCLPVSARELRGVEGWARQVGADAFQVTPPLRAPVAASYLDPETAAAIKSMETSRDPFHYTTPGTLRAIESIWAAGDGEPGAVRRAGYCPVGGIRLDVRADGNLGACPYKPPVGKFQKGMSLRDLWNGGMGHFRAIANCQRICYHPVMKPGTLFPSRL